MTIAVYPGSFDPPTLGHIDIARRAAGLFARLVIGVSTRPGKAPLFTLDERLAMIARELAAAGIAAEVRAFDGLLTDFTRAIGAGTIVRGLRGAMDFDYEQPQAALNRRIGGGVETIFLAADPALQPISSTLVKEIARGGGAVDGLVPPGIAAEIRAKLA